MKKINYLLLAAFVSTAFISVTPAQNMSSASAGIPKVLEIQREFLKPGKSGMVHEKMESAFVQAMSRAKSPTHYIAMTSLSGKNRALFLTSYPSLEAWEKDSAEVAKNAALSAALDRANEADGAILESTDTGVFVMNEELSMNPKADLGAMRFMEISMYHIKAGHTKEWKDAVKLVKDAYQKSMPDAHWGMFEQRFGGEGGTYLLLRSHKTLAEIDGRWANDKKYQEALGDDGGKKLSELAAASIESSQHQLFAFSGTMSYVQDEWIKAYPDFWKPAGGAAPKAKAEAKKEKP